MKIPQKGAKLQFKRDENKDWEEGTFLRQHRRQHLVADKFGFPVLVRIIKTESKSTITASTVDAWFSAALNLAQRNGGITTRPDELAALEQERAGVSWQLESMRGRILSQTQQEQFNSLQQQKERLEQRIKHLKIRKLQEEREGIEREILDFGGRPITAIESRHLSILREKVNAITRQIEEMQRGARTLDQEYEAVIEERLLAIRERRIEAVDLLTRGVNDLEEAMRQEQRRTQSEERYMSFTNTQPLIDPEESVLTWRGYTLRPDGRRIRTAERGGPPQPETVTVHRNELMGNWFW